MVTFANMIIAVGKDSYKYEMKVFNLLDERYNEFVKQYEDTDSPIEGKMYTQHIVLENNYGMEYTDPFITTDYLNHRFFLMYLNRSRQIIMYDSLENKIVTNTSLQPEGVIAGFCEDKVVISDFINNTITILDKNLESIFAFEYSCNEMQISYNVSSILYYNGNAEITISKTAKYWK
jgi:hypothetical protein